MLIELFAEPFVDELLRNRDGLFVVIQDPENGFAAQGSDQTFQLPDTRFPCIIADQIDDFLVAQTELGSRKTIGLDLLRNEMFLGNVQLVHFCVGRQLNDLQTVSQRHRYIVQIVRCSDEQYFGEIVRLFQVVVAEQLVLFRVQYLQQCAGRIAFVVIAEFIDFIDEEHRIDDTGALHALDDPARHGTEVGSSVSADLCFVAYTAQAHLDEPAVQRTGNRSGQ